MNQRTTKVLVLGGTVFMGRTLLKKLSEGENIEVHVINRKKKHWDWEPFSYPNCNFLYADRHYIREFIKSIEYLNRK